MKEAHVKCLSADMCSLVCAEDDRRERGDGDKGGSSLNSHFIEVSFAQLTVLSSNRHYVAQSNEVPCEIHVVIAPLSRRSCQRSRNKHRPLSPSANTQPGANTITSPRREAERYDTYLGVRTSDEVRLPHVHL